MPQPSKNQYHAFKLVHNGLANVLVTDVKVYDFQDKHSAAFKAIWDTGATNSVITKSVVDRLNLQPTGMTRVNGVNSCSEQPTYLVNVGLPNGIKIISVNVTQCELNSPGLDLLIGMDVITLGDFSISHYGKKTIFCFSIPPHHNVIDLVEKAERSNKRKY